MHRPNTNPAIDPAFAPLFVAGRYGFADKLKRNDTRRGRFKRERATRGFDSTELWSLDHTFAKFMADAIPAFRNAYPRLAARARWLGGVERGFGLMIRDDFCFLDRAQDRQFARSVNTLVSRLDEIPILRAAVGAFVAPRLAAFTTAHVGYPADMTGKAWNRAILHMKDAFQRLSDGGPACPQSGRLQPGLRLFIERYRSLWI